uniref:Uncharacterized protein n=1 Tax=Lactuca sativa TaxID=4236 RepID=A0A9R1XMI0_LACSA|nr:hypothetical protein LSAT_V11C300151280 [Lactuca sativa]
MVAFNRLDGAFGQVNLEFWQEIMLSLDRYENFVLLLSFNILRGYWHANIFSDSGLSKFAPANKFTFIFTSTIGANGYCDQQYFLKTDHGRLKDTVRMLENALGYQHLISCGYCNIFICPDRCSLGMSNGYVHVLEPVDPDMKLEPDK